MKSPRPARKPNSKTNHTVHHPVSTRADTAGYILEAQVGHLLRRAHQRHTALFAEHIGAPGLTPTQWAALAKLRELGTLSQNQLARLTAIDSATMQGLIQRLVRRGLVMQRQDRRDKRRIALRLTPTGSALVEACLGKAVRITEETLAPLSPGERKTLLRLLCKLV